MKHFLSDISKQSFPYAERVKAEDLPGCILELVQRDHPGFDANSYLSIGELNDYRMKYATLCIEEQTGKLSELEKTVMRVLKDKSILTNKLEESDLPRNLTIGQKLADVVADFGGSWTFIISFLAFIVAWAALNFVWLANKGFDPYPFILLNLLLSCIAALQAPIIMMSQNRQEEKDRERAKNDYMIDLKAEVEVRMMSEKIDHMLRHQQELLLLQKMQMEMIQEITSRKPVND